MARSIPRSLNVPSSFPMLRKNFPVVPGRLAALTPSLSIPVCSRPAGAALPPSPSAAAESGSSLKSLL